jgi:hypothetical protein
VPPAVPYHRFVGRSLVLVSFVVSSALCATTRAAMQVPEEPVYRGKTRSEWLVELRTRAPAIHPQAVEAIAAFAINDGRASPPSRRS